MAEKKEQKPLGTREVFKGYAHPVDERRVPKEPPAKGKVIVEEVHSLLSKEEALTLKGEKWKQMKDGKFTCIVNGRRFISEFDPSAK